MDESTTVPTTPLWWQRGTIYQIYPRSFQDSDGDGIGDLRGIERRLDYLRWLGVDAIWISPIFPSPMADFGYDVSDYTGIHPMFGSMEDFDRLLQACHERDLKLILDLVPNHSSDRHPWFEDSRSSRNAAKRDWYLWRDPAPDGGPPNNWLSVFGGSAWEFDDDTGQYYYHAFLKEQPDLNWRNPEVRDAMADVMRFWFDKGIDGFRIDVLWHVIKDDQFRENPKNPDYNPNQTPYNQLLPVYSTDQPEAIGVAEWMREVADEYDERVLIGEMYLPIDRMVAYYGSDGRGVHLPFNFQLITLPWDARQIDRVINDYEASLPEGGWPNWVLGNHDNSRIASRVGEAQARVAAVLLLTLRGTPTIYYGDELGLQDVDIAPDQMQDPQGLRSEHRFSRDPERTPMPWRAPADNNPHAGFTSGEPWLPLNEDAGERNVADQQDDPRSMLALYHSLLELRRKYRALSTGDYIPIAASGNAIAYVRTADAEQIAVALNLGATPETVDLEHRTGVAILGTHSEREGARVEGRLELAPDEAVVIHLEKSS